MSEVIYCHQCARENLFSHKFCLKCASPLHLRGNAGDKPRQCSDCGQSNPSFAKFCIQCSNPIIHAPVKGPGANIPLLINNRQATGGENCPACGRAAEPVNRLVERDNAKRASFTGPEGLVVENPSWLAWQLREPTRKPSQQHEKRTLPIPTSGCFPIIGLLVLAFLLVAVLQGVVASLSSVNPLLLIVVVVAIVALVWLGRGYLMGKSILDKAQFRWRQARYCAHCNAIFVAGQTIYTSPHHVNDLLWHSSTEFAPF